MFVTSSQVMLMVLVQRHFENQWINHLGNVSNFLPWLLIRRSVQKKGVKPIKTFVFFWSESEIIIEYKWKV